MQQRRLQRGAGLIEAMAAMAVLMIGAMGTIGLARQSTFFMGDSRRTTRAAEFAQDLVNQIELMPYDDPLLTNPNVGNDGDIGDAAGLFDLAAPAPPYDHWEQELVPGGNWQGIGTDHGPRTGNVLEANGMERYWNVADGGDTNGNGIPDAKRIAVIVRWRDYPPYQAGGPSYRKVVFMVTKVNTSDLR